MTKHSSMYANKEYMHSILIFIVQNL